MNSSWSRRTLRRKAAALALAGAIVLTPAAMMAGPAFAEDVPAAETVLTDEPAEVSEPETEVAPESAPAPAREPAPEPAPEATPEPAPAPAPAGKQETVVPEVKKQAAATSSIDHSGTRYENGGIVFYAPTSVKAGDPIRLSGTGWRNTAGTAGSVVVVKLDQGAVLSTQDVRHPITNAVQDPSVIAMVLADDSGDWELELPFPTLTNSNKAWAAGESHSVRLLTGSTAGDVIRTNTATFTITQPDASQAQTPPVWPHKTVTSTDADSNTTTAWIESQIAAGDSSTIRVKGTGWTNAAKTQGSTLAIKLNSGVGKQYTRSAGDLVEHPALTTADNTIWALLTKSDGDTRDNVFDIDASGNFEVELQAPKGLAAGQHLTLQLQSGRFLTGDVQRMALSDPLTVGGIEWIDDSDPSQNVTCVPTSAGPTVKIETATVTRGEKLHVTGTGWCHPGAKRGGSVVAVKIDEGAYSRLDSSVHENKTIWTLISADPATGVLDAKIDLPTGRTSGANGSDPAFKEGSHTLRLLSGSVKSGDQIRTLQSGSFTVGAYSPNGMPEPLEYTEDLAAAKRAGLTFTKSSKSIKVTVPRARKGDWVFLSAYGSDGSARYPWGDTWFRANDSGVVTAKLSGVTLPEGTSKLVAQSGNQGQLGKLLGWKYLKTPVATTDQPASSSPSGSTSPGGLAGTGTGAGVAPAAGPQPTAAPTDVPSAPVPSSAGLKASNSGDVTGTQDGSVVTVTVPSAQPGDWVFVYAYSEPTPVGWVQLDANKQLKVDVAPLSAGAHKLAVLDVDGKLVGWTSATVAESESTAQAKPVASVASALPDSIGLDRDRWLTATDGWLLAAGVMVLIVASASTLVGRRTPSETKAKSS